MNKLSSIILLALLFSMSALINSTSGASRNKAFRIDIVSIVEIAPITELRKGFRQEFEASEFTKQRKVIFNEYNAQGDSGLINQIVDRIATEKPDLAYVLGTPIAQAIQKRVPDLLIVQGAVTDPVAAGLANSWSASGKKYIATSDLPPVAKQIELIRSLTPNVKRLGIIYNPGEANSAAVVSRFRDQISKDNLNFKLVEGPIANSGEVATVLQSFLGNVDAIYLPPDNTAYAAIPVIGRFAQEHKIPFYATVRTALAQGALATLSLDFFELGKESATLALAVLGGQDPATLPIKLNDNPQVSINAKLAKELGIAIEPFRGKHNVEIVE